MGVFCPETDHSVTDHDADGREDRHRQHVA
jgi:hypothetical protein